VSPLNTVLDDSIGCALWFAARGIGHLRSFSLGSGLSEDSEGDTEEQKYTSKAKVKHWSSASLENENLESDLERKLFTHPMPSCKLSPNDVKRL